MTADRFELWASTDDTERTVTLQVRHDHCGWGLNAPGLLSERRG